MQSLDLFSGIGGITHALRGIAHPVMYSEREESRVKVLKTLFAEGKLPEAPINRDVATLKSDELQAMHIDIVAGGWPCFPAGTPVLTHEGYKCIEHVTTRDTLLTHTGHFQRIVNCQRSFFEGTLYTIKSRHSSVPVTCTDEHPFYVRTRRGPRQFAEPTWVPARALTLHHWVGIPCEIPHEAGVGEDAAEWEAYGQQYGAGAFWTCPPAEVASAPAHLLEAFVKGMEHATSFTFQDYEAALTVQRMLARLGRAMRVKMQHDAYEVLDCGKAYVDEAGLAWFPITGVTRHRAAPPQWVYNFEVDVDNSYVVSNLAVHNCRGFSSIGKRNGFEHPQSALFVHLARLVKDLQPALVFQENVPGVASGTGLDDVLRAYDDAGYDAWWLVMPGYAVGAQQSRKRWFCLGVRRDVREMAIDLDGTYVRHDFTERHPRMRPDKENPQRLSMLGNSVIPDCVRLAFLMLFTGLEIAPVDLWSARRLHLKRPASTGKPLAASGPLRNWGRFVDGVRERMMVPPGVVPEKPDLGLRIVPGAYVFSGQHKAPEENVLTTESALRLWGTPRGGCLGPARVLTQRGKNDLYTSIRFERGTPDEQRGGHPNTAWVENLMGFDEGWTRAAVA